MKDILKIGFDIDGCMNDFQLEMQKVLKRDYNVILPPNEADWISYIAKVSPNIDDFWEKYNGEIEQTMPAEKDAVKILKAVKELGCSRNIITARTYKAAKITEDWLKKCDLTYDNIYWSCDMKLYACQWIGVDFMVEDNPLNAKFLADNGVKVILFEREYNKYLNHENIIHCSTWQKVYDKISYSVYKKILSSK